MGYNERYGTSKNITFDLLLSRSSSSSINTNSFLVNSHVPNHTMTIGERYLGSFFNNSELKNSLVLLLPLFPRNFIFSGLIAIRDGLVCYAQ